MAFSSSFSFGAYRCPFTNPKFWSSSKHLFPSSRSRIQGLNIVTRNIFRCGTCCGTVVTFALSCSSSNCPLDSSEVSLHNANAKLFCTFLFQALCNPRPPLFAHSRGKCSLMAKWISSPKACLVSRGAFLNGSSGDPSLQRRFLIYIFSVVRSFKVPLFAAQSAFDIL